MQNTQVEHSNVDQHTPYDIPSNLRFKCASRYIIEVERSDRNRALQWSAPIPIAPVGNITRSTWIDQINHLVSKEINIYQLYLYLHSPLSPTAERESKIQNNRAITTNIVVYYKGRWRSHVIYTHTSPR